MNGYSRTIGLVLMAVLAMSAAIASTASAQVGQGYLTSEGPVTLAATETGEGNSNALTAFGLAIRCPGSTYTGHKTNATPNTLIPSVSTVFTFTPHYSQEECGTAGLWTTIDMNGCDYVLHIGETTPAGNKEGTYGVSADVVCPGEKSIVVSFFTSSFADTHENKPFCKLEIKSQAGLAGAHARDTGNGHIDITGTVEGMHAVKTNPTNPTTHLILCPTATTNSAKMDFDLTVAGKNAAGGATAISISDPF